MTFSWFAYLQDTSQPELRISEAEQERVLEIVATTPGLINGLVFTPWDISDLYFDDGAPPQLAFELYFEDIGDFEGALSRTGHLQTLAMADTLPTMASANAEQQAMVARSFPAPDAEFRTSPGEPHCSYLVHYPGQAEDPNEWMAYYLDHHPQIMATFPGIRQIEVCSRVDWCGFLPWPRVNYMQRNKVVFDDSDALRTAMSSHVIKDMRADFHNFPPFNGNNIHFPMKTIVVGGS
jgi:hypothetical protein